MFKVVRNQKMNDFFKYFADWRENSYVPNSIQIKFNSQFWQLLNLDIFGEIPEKH